MGKQLRWAILTLVFAASSCLGVDAADGYYVGPETCALCHAGIAAKQERTAMANTWQGKLARWLPRSFDVSVTDDFRYHVETTQGGLAFSVELPDRPKLTLPVQISMGGKRHGLGFLLPVAEVDGLPLARTALVQARYAWNPEYKKLMLAPGCAGGRPQSLESSLGLVLSPTFELRCLQCHGQPKRLGAGDDGGVHCEACHGPGSQHLAALGRGHFAEGIVNPRRLPPQDSMAICAQCHVGLARFSDPSPNDLLIANQVRAIQSSECFLQSRKAFSCAACHDPHGDAADDDERSLNACLGCHSETAKPHAAICPVNAKSNCIGCHMPAVDMGPLHLVDHLIRIHPEQKTVAANRRSELRTQIVPRSEYLRMFASNSAAGAQSARERISGGESFYNVAREFSVDGTAPVGGYLGRKTLTDLGDVLAAEATRLSYGETSGVVRSKGRWILLQRLPRDFRSDADRLESEAEDLAARGDAAGSIGKAQKALMIYPHFLKALSLIGGTFARNGNPRKASDVFRVAELLYPDDAGTQFALASALGLVSDWPGATTAYKRALELEPDFVEAYASLGMISYTAGDWKTAIATFRQGLQIDPMRAELYYDLSLALTRSGDPSGGTQARAIARKLNLQILSADPDTAARADRPGSF